MALKYHEEIPELQDIHVKHLRKILKIGCLAILNGGGIGNPEHVEAYCQSKYSQSGLRLDHFDETISNVIKSASISNELKELMKTMHVKGRTFLMNQEKPFESPERTARCCSAAMGSGEIVSLTFLVEFLSRLNIKLVPISLEHDGVLILTRTPLKQSEIELITSYWKVFVMIALKLDLPIEIKPGLPN